MGLDEYESVLGMPPGPRPPNHYQLLALQSLESKPSVIAAAADARIVEAEESVLASAEQIRRVVERIHLAKDCLLDEKAKADYDRQLDPSVPGLQLEPVAGTGPLAGPGSFADAPHDELQFEPLPAALIEANRPVPKRRTRRWFWALTLVEGLCVLGLYFYLHPPEPVAMPRFAVRGRATAGQPNPTNPPVAQPAPPPQRPATPNQPAPARDPFEPGDPFAPRGTASPDGTKVDKESPPSIEPDNTADAMPPPRPGPADAAEKGPPRETPVQSHPVWPSQWKIQFAGNSDGTIDHELLSLSADEVKALAMLREQPLYTLRDAITKKPTAAVPFDNQGHLSGIVVALLPKNDWRACLAYENQVLQGRARIFDAERKCVYFADYRRKGRNRLLCLCADGVPVAVQIWRGKESVNYLIELADGRPVAREQKQLSAEQTERLGAALVELAAIEKMIRDCEKDWKSQLSDWWKTNDNALRLIALQPIADGEKQTRRTAYYKKLFDEQHAGLDKLLGQFEPPPADPPAAKP